MSVLSLKRLAVCVSVACLTASGAKAENCGELVALDGGIDQVTDFYPLFIRTRNGKVWKFDGSCAYLRGRQFRGSIDFIAKNDFADSGASILRVKSLRTFSTATSTKIKVMRNAGWYRYNDSQAKGALDAIDDQTVNLTPAQWNDAHSTNNTRIINGKLGLIWHGFTGTSPVISSAEAPSYWQLPADETLDRKTLTNYLIRFDASRSQSPVPITVFTPLIVSGIDLKVDSNIEALQTEFRFLLVD